ncbi:hypothetical protein AVEN_153020-1 [Araneus ventricosus]|uniref:Uncharacterized protein n=1 Tax=Araneus ventricosus TaxID=182803 RepID=A0A4Y2AFV4_ARAVE|nr:hypothetical protein AVEN_153020-1 [Araneus ventricosus]
MCASPQFSPPENNALFEIARATLDHAAIPISFLPYKSQTKNNSGIRLTRDSQPVYAYPWGYAKDHLGVREIKLLMAETRKLKGFKKLENFVSPREYLVFNIYTT